MLALAPHAPVRVATRAWIMPARLDRLLLAGADPDASPALRERARALTRKRRRARLADGLRRAVAASETAPVAWTTAVPVERAEVRATRALMLELASRIRAADDPNPASLILTRRLLTDGIGPLFSPAAPGALHDAVVDAILAIEHARPHPR